MNITLKKKMILSFVIIILLIIIEVSVSTFINSKNEQLKNSISELQKETIFLKTRLIDHIQWMNSLLESITTGEEFTGQKDPAKCAFGTWYYEFKDSPKLNLLDQKRQQLFKDMEPCHSALHESFEKIDNAKNRNEALRFFKTETKANVTNLQNLFNEYLEEVGKIITVNESDMNDMKRITIIAGATSVGTVLLVIIISLALGIWIVRTIMNSISLFKEGFGSVAGGNLKTEINNNNKDEFGELAIVFNSFVERIRNIL